MPRYILDNLPFSPSVNAMYATFVNPKFISYIQRGGNPRNPKGPRKTFRVLTDEANSYKARMAQWALYNSDLVKKISEKLKGELLFEDKAIEVSAFFCMPKERIWYKNGKIRKLDAANRIKGLHDSLSDVLDIDDKYFYPGPSPKVILSEDRTAECILVVMEPKPVMEWENLKKNLIENIPSLQSIEGSERKSS